MRYEKEGKQIDREYGATEITNIQKLTAAMVSFHIKNKKSAIHVARFTIHEAGVKNRLHFSDKLVENRRWQIG